MRPKAVDGRQIAEALSEGGAFAWNWQKQSLKPPKNFLVQKREMLLSGELVPILGAASYEEAEKLINHLKETNSSVKFEDCPS